MSTRLFHTVILVGASLGAALAAPGCGGSVNDSSPDDAKSDAGDSAFATISPAGGDTAIDPRDTGWSGIRADTMTYDSFHIIAPADTGHDSGNDTGKDAADTGVDTWPGITPVLDTGTDTFPGISPPPPPRDGG